MSLPPRTGPQAPGGGVGLDSARLPLPGGAYRFRSRKEQEKERRGQKESGIKKGRERERKKDIGQMLFSGLWASGLQSILLLPVWKYLDSSQGGEGIPVNFF